MRTHTKNGVTATRLYKYDRREFRSVQAKLQQIAANSRKETIVHGAAQMGAEAIACLLSRLCENEDQDEAERGAA